ncbi:MAG: ABC transporter permease subunit [Acetobacteraceae bacterium]|nr:ABC transporter permease subunit [Acetobacteraceae bacterium]
MRATLVVARRELAGYFATPVAYVFIVIFLVLAGALAFNAGNFFERGQADLVPFFTFVPWLFLLLTPAITMRLWAEERRAGTIETLLTLPLSTAAAVVGKFAAALAFTTIALALTFPLVITVNELGSPDNGVIAAGYIAALLVAACFLAVGGAMSALTRNQVIAFVLGAAVCFLFTLFGSPIVTDLFGGRLPPELLAGMKRIALIERFNGIVRGVVSLRDLVFFLSFTAFWLFVTVQVVELKKAA